VTNDFDAVSAAVWRISPDCSQDVWWRGRAHDAMSFRNVSPSEGPARRFARR